MSDRSNSLSETPDGQIVREAYWRANIALLVKLLAIWFAVSFGAGILFADALNAFQFFGFKLGFWFAQQGSIFVFVVLIFVYSARMQSLERRFGLSDEDEPDSYDLLPEGDRTEGDTS